MCLCGPTVPFVSSLSTNVWTQCPVLPLSLCNKGNGGHQCLPVWPRQMLLHLPRVSEPSTGRVKVADETNMSPFFLR